MSSIITEAFSGIGNGV